MIYLLDTNIWIGLARNEPGVLRRVSDIGPKLIATCSVVRAELLFGARKSQRVKENLLGFERLLAPFRSLPFDDEAAAHYGVIRAVLESAGTPIGANDLMIAAIARTHDCLLVTRNSREFRRVAGLKLAEWDT